MGNHEEVSYRSRIFSEQIRQRKDERLRKRITEYTRPLKFYPLKNLMISKRAWQRIRAEGIEAKYVFSHPDLLQHDPSVSQYYRGMALLSQKQVARLVGAIAHWEEGTQTKTIQHEFCLSIARLYNAVISSIIEDSADWTLENGYRNIVATMGIRLDGMYRNKIGQMAEDIVKIRIVNWLKNRSLILNEADDVYTLRDETVMRYGSEPDITFERGGKIIATIEIKGGTDPAGSLERLGAMQKSFAETPPGCINFLIAGVVTQEMQNRLDQIGMVKYFLLNDLKEDDQSWENFMQEVFHHTVRIVS